MSGSASLASPNSAAIADDDGRATQVWSDHIDSVTRLASGAVSAAAAKMTGPASVDGVNGAAKVMQFTTAGALRWDIGGSATAEPAGANSGTDFVLRRYDNNGVLMGVSMTIVRQNGSISFSGPFGVWGKVGPLSQPGRCVNLGDVIGLLANYGFTV